MVKRWFFVVVMLWLASVLVLGCGIPEKTYDAVVVERDDALAENTALLEKNANLQTMLEKVQSDLAKLQVDYDTLESDYDKLRVDHDELRILYDELSAGYEALRVDYDELKADYEATEQELVEIEEVSQPTELITRHYAWIYGGGEWTWDVQIPQALYCYYQELPRPPTRNYSVYVTHPLDDDYISNLANKIQDAASEEGYDAFQTVEFAIAFVQSLPYTVDSVSTPYDEYPRYPIEALVDNGGDCEDTSILLASIIDKMGYGVVLIILPNHVGVGVKGGENIYGTYWEYKSSKYYYVETTGENWGIGELPKEYEEATANVYDMTPTPILAHTWTATSKGTTVELEVTIENLGSGAAYDVIVFTGFDAGAEMLWNMQESQPFHLPINEYVTIRFVLQPPVGEHTRLVIQIVDDGYAVDKSYSDWFDT